MERASIAHVRSMVVIGGSLEESREALVLANKYNLYATVGCHPTRTEEFEEFAGGPDAYLGELDVLLERNVEGVRKVVAVGECGLDYDRTHFAAPDIQKKYFRAQLGLARKYHLPLFLHSRAAHADLVQILREEGFGVNGGRNVGGRGGVVHSFTGSLEEITELMDMGFHIGVNGCSLKSEVSLDVVKAIRLDRIVFETDAPWCTMTSTHASHVHLDAMPSQLHAIYRPMAAKPEKFSYGKPVKGRSEPSNIGCVAWVFHEIHQIPFEEVTRNAWNNTVTLFGLNEYLD
ncbi:hypothetical protein AX17_000094 [Amanita inopinata Kibby_2008]|nr:hypothetical protein AX17_000094 [Amanita inopinata Kibby_2008]